MARAATGIVPTEYYTLKDVCALLKISEATARRWVRQGVLRGVKVGRDYRFLGHDLIRRLDEARVSSDETPLRPFGPDHPLLALAGVGESGHSDISDEHDRYLAEWTKGEP
jgi:excisionase family DNA binding protein